MREDEALKYIEFGYTMAKRGYSLEVTKLMFIGVWSLIKWLGSLSK